MPGGAPNPRGPGGRPRTPVSMTATFTPRAAVDGPRPTRSETRSSAHCWTAERVVLASPRAWTVRSAATLRISGPGRPCCGVVDELVGRPAADDVQLTVGVLGDDPGVGGQILRRSGALGVAGGGRSRQAQDHDGGECGGESSARAPRPDTCLASVSQSHAKVFGTESGDLKPNNRTMPLFVSVGGSLGNAAAWAPVSAAARNGDREALCLCGALPEEREHQAGLAEVVRHHDRDRGAGHRPTNRFQAIIESEPAKSDGARPPRAGSRSRARSPASRRSPPCRPPPAPTRARPAPGPPGGSCRPSVPMTTATITPRSEAARAPARASRSRRCSSSGRRGRRDSPPTN